MLKFSYVSEKAELQRETYTHLNSYKMRKPRLELHSPTLPSSSHPFLALTGVYMHRRCLWAPSSESP